MTRSRRKTAGYSLVEVLIAVAVTGFVLLTVVTLFYMGRRNVYSGKQMSYGVSVATRMLEDLSALTAPEMMAAFGIDDTTATATVTQNFPMPGSQYSGSYVVDTDNITAANDPRGYLANWKTLLSNANLANADAGIIFTPRSSTNANAVWTSAQIVKARVFVAWDEGGRRRYAYFDTTKSNRG
jgi:Tfp pilus assembly protein PilV